MLNILFYFSFISTDTLRAGPAVSTRRCSRSARQQRVCELVGRQVATLAQCGSSCSTNNEVVRMIRVARREAKRQPLPYSSVRAFRLEALRLPELLFSRLHQN